jgi:flagellar protein FliL
MATAATTDAAEVPAKKGGALKMIVAVVLAAGLAGGGAFFFASKKAATQAPAEGGAVADEAHGEHAAEHSAEHADEHGGGHDEGAPKSPGSDYFSLPPAFVVNLNDDEAMRFLQVEIEVAAPKASTQEAVKASEPLIRNRLMLLFSSQRYHALLSREAKEKLQQQALDEINKVMDEQKKAHVANVVFTSFVMQ